MPLKFVLGVKGQLWQKNFVPMKNITMWLLTCKNTSLSNNKSEKATT